MTALPLTPSVASLPSSVHASPCPLQEIVLLHGPLSHRCHSFRQFSDKFLLPLWERLRVSLDDRMRDVVMSARHENPLGFERCSDGAASRPYACDVLRSNPHNRSNGPTGPCYSRVVRDVRA